MGVIDYNKLLKTLVNTKIPKPQSGTLSGHAAGEPFDKHVYSILKTMYKKNIYRQFEFLNDLYLRNPKHLTYEQRMTLLDSPTALFLLSRGKDAVTKWEVENQFEEKQNDTADIIYVDKNKYELIDVKTRNISKTAMPPNIISAYKLAKLCALMIDNKEYDTIGINYIEVDWELKGNYLVCKNAHYADLFRENPSRLYINWAAALQLQFHVASLTQSFNKNKNVWCHEYIKTFVIQAKARAQKMLEKYVKPFEKYLK
jgi:type II restriction enzyme